MGLSLDEFIECLEVASVDRYLRGGNLCGRVPSAYVHDAVLLDKAFCPVDEKNVVFTDHTDFMHSTLSFVDSLIFDLAPCQYCAGVMRVIRTATRMVRDSFELVHADYACGNSEVQQLYDCFMSEVTRIREFQAARFVERLSHCRCDVDCHSGLGCSAMIPYDSALTVYSLMHFGVPYYNTPLSDPMYQRIQNDLSGVDEVDGKIQSERGVRHPTWLKRVLVRTRQITKKYVIPALRILQPVVAVAAACATVADFVDAPETPKKEDRVSIVSSHVVEVQGGETPESVADCSVPNEPSVDVVHMSNGLPILGAESRIEEGKLLYSEVEHSLAFDDYLMNSTVSFPDPPSGTNPVKVFRMKTTAYPRLALISRMYAYMRMKWSVRLHTKMPFGVNGMLKVVPLDAGTVGDGAVASVPTYNDVMSRQGILWNIADEPEKEFIVPWQRPDFVCTHGDTSAAFAMAFVTPPVIPSGAQSPLTLAVDLKPTDVKFYVRRAVPPMTFPATEISVNATGVDFLLPEEGGRFVLYSNTANTQNITFSYNPGSGVVTQNLMVAGVFSSAMVGTAGLNTTLKTNAGTAVIGFIRNSFTTATTQGAEFHENGGPIAGRSTPGFSKKAGAVMGHSVGVAHVDVAAENEIFVPVKTVSYPAIQSGAVNFKVCPRNFGLSGNSGTFVPSQATQEAERFVFYGPKSGNKFITAKITSVSNAYTNARLVVGWVPPGETLPTTVASLSQYRNVEHTLHGGETVFPLDWIHPLPALYTNSSTDFAGTLVMMLIENITVAAQGTPQFTLWVSANGMEYSTPRAPIAFTPLA